MATRNLPPLEVGQAYIAAEFERFEYCGSALKAGQKAILRLHLKNGTTIDLPVNDAELTRLAQVMAAAFPTEVISVFRQNGWVS